MAVTRTFASLVPFPLWGGSAAALLLVVSCGSADPEPSAETEKVDPTEAFICEEDADCDDGLFCNGEEICSPAVDASDEHGCLTAKQPSCVSDEVCDEALAACVAECDEVPDADGDGSIARACGGDDCDDSDSDRYPGNEEVCDDDDRDEDCDPNTFGFRDQDMDGWPDNACCNGDTCGTDCDDTVAVIHPTESELCDGLDNDCNGEVDDGVAFGEMPIWYRDVDGDGFGLQSAQRAECTDELPGYTRLGGDCDDLLDTTNPDGDEVCDGRDNDCDPGTHACWIHSRLGAAVRQPSVGTEGTIPFELNCAPYGEGVAEWQFDWDAGDQIIDVGIVCGDYGLPYGVNWPYSPLADGVFTPPEFPLPLGDEIITGDDCVGLPGNGGDVSTPMGFVFQDVEINDGFALARAGLTCGATRLFTESLEFEVDEVKSEGPAGPHAISCPIDMTPVGIYGTFTSFPTDGEYVTSMGMICAPIFGIETVE